MADGDEPSEETTENGQENETKAKEMDARLTALRANIEKLKNFDYRLLRECRKTCMDKENWSSRQIRSIDLYVESFTDLRDLNWDVVESYGKWADLTGKEEDELEKEGPIKPSEIDRLDQLLFIEEIRKQLLSFADCQPEIFSKMRDYRVLVRLSRSEPTNLTAQSLPKGPPLEQSNRREDRARSHTSRSQSSIFTTKSNASVAAIEDLEKRIEIYK